MFYWPRPRRSAGGRSRGVGSAAVGGAKERLHGNGLVLFLAQRYFLPLAALIYCKEKEEEGEKKRGLGLLCATEYFITIGRLIIDLVESEQQMKNLLFLESTFPAGELGFVIYNKVVGIFMQ